ncbi:MAG TPA: hypothetical protein VH352_15660 [Pseudonocardiaceae bacterium]|nr:hypothetical protein [Pseudonocardiaceae bacterium]
MPRLRRSIPLAAIAAIVMTTGLLSPAAATATHRPDHDRPPVIAINVTTQDGFSMPSMMHAGLVTFRISSPEAGHAIQGFSLKNGATLDQAITDFNLVLGGDRPTVVAALKNLYHDVTEIGGVVASTFAAQEVTVPLTAGTYYFVDLNDIDNPPLTPRVHTLRVHGAFHESDPPRFTSVITSTMQNGMPVFVAPTTMRHDGTFLAVVSGDELHESVFRPIRPGVTDAYISQFYDAFENGTALPPSPWTGIQAGLQALSPGRWAIVHIDLPPGPYALICYVPSDENGEPHGHMGMHHVMTLT